MVIYNEIDEEKVKNLIKLDEIFGRLSRQIFAL